MGKDIHNYSKKLRHPHLVVGVERTLRSTSRATAPHPGSLRSALASHQAGLPGPVSINLDLTVACNYSCTHCIDLDVLNTRHRFPFDDVLSSLAVLRMAGLRSVILIGGGEPTLSPHFVDAVRAIKLLDLECAVVSNGSSNHVLIEVAPLLRPGDWIRLSLDAATDETFQVMHRPRARKQTLSQICFSAAKIKQANHAVSLGFSYIVTWAGATVQGRRVVGNISEMAAAARLAKENGFDYIAFKPILDRDELGAERICAEEGENGSAGILTQIRQQLDEARSLEDGTFRLVESVNLRGLLEPGRTDTMKRQPSNCHMHHFRQVLTPLGTFGCPVYRGVAKDQVGASGAYRSADEFLRTRRHTFDLIESFDASVECANVTCLYNDTNWWLEGVKSGDPIPPLRPGEESNDFFL